MYEDTIYSLVFSDEFEESDRRFDDGYDPAWTALEKNDYTNDALHYYSASNVRTSSGSLIISTEPAQIPVLGYDDVEKKKTHIKKYFRSGMLQSWNKFCFTGGIIEAEVELPGEADVGGLWPAFWILGNFARHTYVGSADNIWPWSLSTCSKQYSKSQKISGCERGSHYDLEPGKGRGAPEIDIFEVQPGNTRGGQDQFKMMGVGQPCLSASLQIAPGKSWNRPGPGTWPGPGEWYENLVYGPNTTQNVNFYGTYNHFKNAPSANYDYWSDAISFNRQLYDEHFSGFHKYRLEWELPDEDAGGGGYLRWFIDGDLILAINGTEISKVTGAQIPSEPSSIILNTAVSKQWGFPTKCPQDCPCSTSKYDCSSPHFNDKCGFSPNFCDMLNSLVEEENGGAEYKVNYVRVWQNADDVRQKVGCSTPERPTKKWIKAHSNHYSREEDNGVPLKAIERGGAACESDGDCGGGMCKNSACKCRKEYVGPSCRAYDKKNVIDWDPDDGIADVKKGAGLPIWLDWLCRRTKVVVGIGVVGVLIVALVILKRDKLRHKYVLID